MQSVDSSTLPDSCTTSLISRHACSILFCYRLLLGTCHVYRAYCSSVIVTVGRRPMRVLYIARQSLTVLMYAMPALPLKSRQLDELNVCWNNVIRKLFNYNKWESVKSVLFHIDRLNVTHLIMMRKINFYLICMHQKTVLCIMFLCRFCRVVVIICVSQFLNKSLLQLN